LNRTVEQFGIDGKFFAWPPAGDPNRPPYRGLRSLEAEDAGIFFGRDGLWLMLSTNCAPCVKLPRPGYLSSLAHQAPASHRSSEPGCLLD